MVEHRGRFYGLMRHFPLLGKRLYPPESHYFNLQDLHTFSNRLGKAVVSNGSLSVENLQNLTHAQIIQKLQTEQLTNFGDALRNIVKGRKFIDLGCGNPSYSIAARLVAQAYQAEAYVGVDLDLPTHYHIEPSDTPTSFIKSDMLKFLSRLHRSRAGVVFHLAGIEPIAMYQEDRLETDEYTHTVLKHMSRVARKGDAIIIGEGTSRFDPIKYGFKLMHTAMAIDRDELEYPSQRLYIKQ